MDYWKQREIIEREKLLDKTINECNKELKDSYRKTSYRIIKEIQKLYVEINSEEEVLPSHLYQYNRYYEILANIEKLLNTMSKQLITLIDKNMTKLYKQNVKLVDKYTGFTTKIDELIVKNTVYSYWVADGNNWSDRVWKNKRLLVQFLEKNITDIVTTGRSHEEVTKELMKTFNMGYANAERLIRTELAHVQIQSTLDSYSNAGLTQYMYLTAKDEKTCDVCGALNGKVFYIDECNYGVNLPPMHPNCRCSILGQVSIPQQNNKLENTL